MRTPVDDLTGRRFGMLTVVQRSPTLGRHTRWVCACDCGGERIASRNNLLHQNMSSCGCALRRTPEPEPSPHDEYIYQDTGCPDLGIPACLSCPLPECRYLMGPKVAAAIIREQQTLTLLGQGMTFAEAARELGISKRSVFRLKKGEASRKAGLAVTA